MWVTASAASPASSRASSMQAHRPGAVRGGRGDVVGVGGAGRADDLRVDVSAPGQGPFQLLEDQHGPALAHDEAVPLDVEGHRDAAAGQGGHVGEAGHARSRSSPPRRNRRSPRRSVRSRPAGPRWPRCGCRPRTRSPSSRTGRGSRSASTRPPRPGCPSSSAPGTGSPAGLPCPGARRSASRGSRDRRLRCR